LPNLDLRSSGSRWAGRRYGGHKSAPCAGSSRSRRWSHSAGHRGVPSRSSKRSCQGRGCWSSTSNAQAVTIASTSTTSSRSSAARRDRATPGSAVSVTVTNLNRCNLEASKASARPDENRGTNGVHVPGQHRMLPRNFALLGAEPSAPEPLRERRLFRRPTLRRDTPPVCCGGGAVNRSGLWPVGAPVAPSQKKSLSGHFA
jgi:hypothetical protein